MVAVQTQQVVKCSDCKRPVAEWTRRGLEVRNVRSVLVVRGAVTLHCGHKHPYRRGRCGREITIVMGRTDRQELGGAA